MVWIIAPQYQALMPRERWQPRDRPLHFMEVEGTAQQSRMILRLRVLQLIPQYVRSELSLPDSREGFAAGSDLKGNTPPRSISDLLWVERRQALSWIHQLLWTRFFLSTSICMLTSPSPLSQQLKYLSVFCSGFGSKQAIKPRTTGEEEPVFLQAFWLSTGWGCYGLKVSVPFQTQRLQSSPGLVARKEKFFRMGVGVGQSPCVWRCSRKCPVLEITPFPQEILGMRRQGCTKKSQQPGS